MPFYLLMFCQSQRGWIWVKFCLWKKKWVKKSLFEEKYQRLEAFKGFEFILSFKLDVSLQSF